MSQKLLTKGSLQPGKIFMLGSPTPNVILFMSLPAEDTPSLLPFTPLDTASHEVSSFGGQGQMLASFNGRGVAERTISLVHHGEGVALTSVSR
jgi:hypothetical protein